MGVSEIMKLVCSEKPWQPIFRQAHTLTMEIPK